MADNLVVKLIVLNQTGQILVLRRSPEDNIAPGRIDFPGGAVEPNETLDAAARRELQEEAGLKISPDNLKLAYTFTRPGRDAIVVHRFLFITKTNNAIVVLSEEHDDYSWLDFDEVKRQFEGLSWEPALDFIAEHQLLA